MTRKDNPRSYIIEYCDEHLFYEQMLKELVAWLSHDDLNEFIETSFGNEGF